MPLHSQNSWRDGFQVGQGHLRSPHIPISLTRKKRNCNNNQSPFAECAPCARSCVRFFSSFRNAVTETSATSRRWQNRSTSHCKIYQLNLLRPLLSADKTGIMLLTSQGGVRSTHDKPSLWKHLAPCPALASAWETAAAITNIVRCPPLWARTHKQIPWREKREDTVFPFLGWILLITGSGRQGYACDKWLQTVQVNWF